MRPALFSALLLTAVFALTAGGCASGRSDAPDSTAATPVPLPPEPEPAPAPGTAIVQATIATCEAPTSDSHRCTVRVEKVIAYGAGVAPLATGRELVITTSERAVQRAGAGTGGPVALTPGARFRFVLRQPMAGVGQSTASDVAAWAALSLTQ